MDTDGNLYVANESSPVEDLERARLWAEKLEEQIDFPVDRVKLAEAMRSPLAQAKIEGRT